VLTNVPVLPDPSELVPFPVVFTGALVLINGDRDVPGPVVPVVPEPLPLFPAGAGVAEVDAVSLVPSAVGVAVPLAVPTVPPAMRIHRSGMRRQRRVTSRTAWTSRLLRAREVMHPRQLHGRVS
jgi:hypothetical protein